MSELPELVVWPKKRKLRKDLIAGVPIAGFTGINGAGKTLMAVESAICDMAAGRKVYSTVKIESPWGNSEPIQSLRQLAELSDATLLFDEVSVIFSSRSSSTLPSELVALLQTLRHRRLTVRWTAPAWMRCDNLLREVTQALVNVAPLVRKKVPGSAWPRPLVTMAGLLDTSSGKTDATPTRVMARRMLVPSHSPAWGMYDTMADTPLLGRHLQGGICVDCGGTMERHKHSEARHTQLGLPYFGESSRAPVQFAPAAE